MQEELYKHWSCYKYSRSLYGICIKLGSEDLVRSLKETVLASGVCIKVQKVDSKQAIK
jgi:hypothetical protein